MKKIWIFILGIVTGIILMLAFSVIYVKCSSGKKSLEGITLFEEVGDCVSSNSFEVLQVLESGAALATEIKDYSSSSPRLTVLFWNEDGQSYYDDQVIKIPIGKCARQVGIFKYLTKGNHDATVPVVVIR